jgi:hypothetical protein
MMTRATPAEPVRKARRGSGWLRSRRPSGKTDAVLAACST